jgi:hypothetical protein
MESEEHPNAREMAPAERRGWIKWPRIKGFLRDAAILTLVAGGLAFVGNLLITMYNDIRDAEREIETLKESAKRTDEAFTKWAGCQEKAKASGEELVFIWPTQECIATPKAPSKVP